MGFEGLTNKKVKVRKPHSCIWCGEAIFIGQEAVYRSYLMDGEFMADYLHPECYYDGLQKTDYDLIEDGFNAFIGTRGKPLTVEDL